MSVQTFWPGVYVSEFEPGPPIQAAGTSTAAFLGPARSGPIDEPVQLTSWDSFVNTFGAAPVNDTLYLWYAVRGFFENGGQVCYVVRISNAAAARYALPDHNGVDSLVVEALDEGAAGDGIQIRVDLVSAITAGNFRHSANVAGVNGGTELVCTSADDVVQFRPGDIVAIDGAAERAAVMSTSGTSLRLTQPLPAAAPGTTVRLADVVNADGDSVLRVEISAGQPRDLAAGSVLEIQQGGAPSSFRTVKTAVQERVTLSTSAVVTTYRVTTTDALPDLDMSAAAPAVNITSHEFTLTVQPPAGPAEVFANLAMNPVSPNYWAVRVNGVSQQVRVSQASPPTSSPAPQDIPNTLALTNLAGGADENLGTLLSSDYQEGLDALALRNDVSIVAIPDGDLTVQEALVAHCEGSGSRIGDRVAVIASQRGAPPTGAGSVADQKGALQGIGRGYAALYYPWVLVPPAPPPPGSPPPTVAPPPVLVPPVGHVAGIYARTDLSRGVHKAPAGTEAIVRGAVGVERVLGDVDQGTLNIQYGVDVIRVFTPGGAPVVWGARTTATGVDSNWQYVSTRRLFIFLEQSLIAGLRSAVFEPNNLALWGKVRRSITAFLTQVWRDGALFGETAKDAFYVRIDDTLNPPDQMALGRLTVEVGVRPAYPAEFIVVRIGIWDGGAQVTEQ